MMLLLDIGTGVLTVFPDPPDPIHIMRATSGRGGCMNDRRASCVRRAWEGPIPPGGYELRVSEISNPGGVGDWLRQTGGDWGDWRVVLHPMRGTRTHGRSNFFLHGGSRPGSAGCIDIGGGDSGNRATHRLLRELLAARGGRVTVVAM
jgi:hypothetical protein